MNPNSVKYIKSFSYVIILIVTYAIAASQALQSFSYKWTTIAIDKQYPLNKVFDGDVPKPYAVRVLVPTLINHLHGAVPAIVSIPITERSRRLLESVIGAQESAMISDTVALKYGILIALNFSFLLATLFILRALTKQAIGSSTTSRILMDGSPLCFALFLTISYRAYNGFWYDHAELLLYTLYLFLVIGRFRAASLFVLAVSVFNKETAILFPVIVFFALYKDELIRRDLAVYSNIILHASIAAIAFVSVRYTLEVQNGVAAEFHLLGNLSFWFSLNPWLSVTTPHVALIPLPKPSNILLLLPMLAVFFSYWNVKPNLIKNGLAISLTISLPLFLAFCYRDEFRNLSLAFPFLFLSAVNTAANFYKIHPQ